MDEAGFVGGKRVQGDTRGTARPPHHFRQSARFFHGFLAYVVRSIVTELMRTSSIGRSCAPRGVSEMLRTTS